MEEEIIYIVDENNKFVRKATRKEVMERGLLHRHARLIIVNKDEKLLVQKRSLSKDKYPGYWDVRVAGTVKEGDGYESTAMHELYEEVGITGISNIQLMLSLMFKFTFHSLEYNVLCKVYKIQYDGKLKLQEEEVDEAKYMSIEEIKNIIEKEPFHPVGKIVFEKYLETKTKIQ